MPLTYKMPSSQTLVYDLIVVFVLWMFVCCAVFLSDLCACVCVDVIIVEVVYMYEIIVCWQQIIPHTNSQKSHAIMYLKYSNKIVNKKQLYYLRILSQKTTTTTTMMTTTTMTVENKILKKIQCVWMWMNFSYDCMNRRDLIHSIRILVSMHVHVHTRIVFNIVAHLCCRVY